MPPDLRFRLLPAPPPLDLLMVYRRDANADGEPPSPAPGGVRGKVQWVAVDVGQQQVGIARLEIAATAFCLLSELMILSAHRGQGIGRWFMQRIEQYCVDQGIARLLLEAAAGTDHFYQSQAYVDFPLLPRLMCKELSA